MLYLKGISSSLVGYAGIHSRNSLKIKLYQMNDSNTSRRGFSAAFKALFRCLTKLTNPQHLVLVWFLIQTVLYRKHPPGICKQQIEEKGGELGLAGNIMYF